MKPPRKNLYTSNDFEEGISLYLVAQIQEVDIGNKVPPLKIQKQG